jgi:hypothetical protein
MRSVNAWILKEWQFLGGAIDLTHLGMNSEANRLESVQTDYKTPKKTL